MAPARYLYLTTQDGIIEVHVSTRIYEVLLHMRHVMRSSAYQASMTPDGEMHVCNPENGKEDSPLEVLRDGMSSVKRDGRYGVKRLAIDMDLTQEETLAILCAGWNTIDVAVCRTVSRKVVQAIRQTLLDIFRLKEVDDGV